MTKEIQPIALGSIKGLHRSVQEVLDTVRLPALRQVGSRVIKESLLIEIINQTPIRLVKTSHGEFLCTGNVATFQVALRTLSLETNVACVIEPKLDAQSIKRRVLIEVFVGRPVLGFHQTDVPAYYAAFRRAIDAGLITEPENGASSYIADMFGVDSRRLSSILANSDATKGPAPDVQKVVDQSGPTPSPLVSSGDDKAANPGQASVSPEVAAIQAEPDHQAPKIVMITDLQKKNRNRPISGVALDRKGRSIGLFVPLAADVTRKQVECYRKMVIETDETLAFIENVFSHELMRRISLESFDV